MKDGECKGVIAWNLNDGTIHRFRSHITIIATGGLWKNLLFSNCRTCVYRRWQRYGVACRLTSCRIWRFVQFHPTGLYGIGCLISEAVRGEGGYLT